jgi:glycosyltransferase involved in cell wall biosynthesis
MHTDIKKWDFLRQGKFFDEKYRWYTEWVSDEELIKIYQSCKFVSGLRSGQGFEVGVLEGIANGCRPICFDNIYYRQFFNDFAIFIPEEFDVDMTNNLANIFRKADEFKVNVDEIKYVREKFKWETVANNFWKEVLQSL